MLDAARARFAAVGYDRTRIRDVAADAGVDPALVHYFFKSKDGLFTAVMELPFSPADMLAPLLASGVEGLGERLVRRVLTIWDDPGNRAALLAMLRGASSRPEAAAALREFLMREVIGRVAAAVGEPLRANLVGSQIVGLIVARYVVGVQPLAGLEREEVVRLVAPTIQRYLDGPL